MMDYAIRVFAIDASFCCAICVEFINITKHFLGGCNLEPDLEAGRHAGR